MLHGHPQSLETFTGSDLSCQFQSKAGNTARTDSGTKTATGNALTTMAASQPQGFPSTPKATESLEISEEPLPEWRSLSSESPLSSNSPSEFDLDSDSEPHQSPDQTPLPEVTPLLVGAKRVDLSLPERSDPDSEARSNVLSLQTPVEERGRRRERRTASAEIAAKARRWFTSPDRFLSSRPLSTTTESAIRFSKAPQKLRPREKYSRQRDHSVDPFRTTSQSTSRQALNRRQLDNGPRSSPLHFTPSFVHGNNATPVHVDANGNADIPRQISAGAVWHVGGPITAQLGPVPGIFDGRGGIVGSGTNAPMHFAHFLDRETADQDLTRHENRLALALDIDQARRILGTDPSIPHVNIPLSSNKHTTHTEFSWHNNSWVRQGGNHSSQKLKNKPQGRAVPVTPFRVLDAPRLRDDFYCSTLAYSYSSRTLAVGLSNRVYLWSEEEGVQYPPLASARPANYVTSVSFSSTDGGHNILAVGRQGGQVSLWNPLESEPKFEAQHPNPVSCVCFKPTATRRPSVYFQHPTYACEDLLVGDDLGNVYFYSVEWAEAPLPTTHPHLAGLMTLLSKISAHAQQICGLAWSPDGNHFATGGNDNAALLFEVSKVLSHTEPSRGRSILQQTNQSYQVLPYPTPPVSPERVPNFSRLFDRARRSATPSPSQTSAQAAREATIRLQTASYLLPASFSNNLATPPATPPVLQIHNNDIVHRVRPTTDPRISNHPPGLQKHTFPHSAAVKALAFASWQPSLLATGGGSNDRQIHFFHTGSGATLALISVWAQVTSLIWSKTRREIAATFGYAQPEHGIRIAVFAWPSGECVVSIPWGKNGADPTQGLNSTNGDGGRALWAIPYPGGPNDCSVRRGRNEDKAEGEAWGSRTEEEGCIIVAGSDESVKFHEIWAGKSSGKGQGLGMSGGVLGGSSILEGVCEGIDVERGEVIR